MALLDLRTKFVEATAVSASAGTALVGSQIDLSVARDIGNGRPIYWVILVEAAFTSGGSATVDFKLVSDASASIATNGTASQHLSTGALAYTELTLGKTIIMALPNEGIAYERFLGVLVVTAGATTTAGSISTFLTPDAYSWKAYPEANS